MTTSNQPVETHDPRHHVTPMKTYFIIFGTLLVLTYLTYQISFFDLGILNTPIALGIAVTKATLVILFFMHVLYSTRVTWMVIFGSLLMLVILLGLTFIDYMSRGWSLH
ncbi:MAG: cytochrome C oxidase subunit IV family protein [Thermoanaerobaculia bacterium]